MDLNSNILPTSCILTATILPFSISILIDFQDSHFRDVCHHCTSVFSNLSVPAFLCQIDSFRRRAVRRVSGCSSGALSAHKLLNRDISWARPRKSTPGASRPTAGSSAFANEAAEVGDELLLRTKTWLCVFWSKCPDSSTGSQRENQIK